MKEENLKEMKLLLISYYGNGIYKNKSGFKTYY